MINNFSISEQINITLFGNIIYNIVYVIEDHQFHTFSSFMNLNNNIHTDGILNWLVFYSDLCRRNTIMVKHSTLLSEKNNRFCLNKHNDKHYKYTNVFPIKKDFILTFKFITHIFEFSVNKIIHHFS